MPGDCLTTFEAKPWQTMVRDGARWGTVVQPQRTRRMSINLKHIHNKLTSPVASLATDRSTAILVDVVAICSLALFVNTTNFISRVFARTQLLFSAHLARSTIFTLTLPIPTTTFCSQSLTSATFDSCTKWAAHSHTRDLNLPSSYKCNGRRR